MRTGSRFRRAAACAALCAACAAEAAMEGGYGREETAVPDRAGRGAVTALAAKLPFAYYPSVNRFEAAVELGEALKAKAGGPVSEAEVRILDAASGREAAAGRVPLGADGRGQAVFDIPDLPEGEYRVEYVLGRHVERSPVTFKRIRFPFEGCDYGTSREVYPPFTPVEADGPTVRVVGRAYRLNALGLFDSVVAAGREVLAEPMKLVVETADGGRAAWTPVRVEGRATHPDTAVYETEAEAPGLRVRSSVEVQEDGCAKVAMTLAPRPGTEGADAPTTTVRRAWLEIAWKDAEAPLFHWFADEALRLNYAGDTPRGGRIEWYREPWDHWVPIRWRAAGAAPADGEIWNAKQVLYHQQAAREAERRPFVPYVWLGGGLRGLAFFMESERGFAIDGDRPVQTVARRDGAVVLRVEIVQRPVVLDAPRAIEFGLMASPGKPMEPDFRTRRFASGLGPVICWGGWHCNSKYPDHNDWTVVDRIQAIRRRGDYTEEDARWIEDYYRGRVAPRNPGRTAFGEGKPWTFFVQRFAFLAGAVGRTKSGVYFEEHATDPLIPEWQVFQDEWSGLEFPRFQEKKSHWGVFSPSYHDFALYYANEWMRRGISLYFDNAFPKRCYNPRFGPAWRGEDGVLRFGMSLFAQRAYYRRVFKRMSELNASGQPEYRLDVTHHMTNGQVIPLTTWATATLDLEIRGHHEDPEKVPMEVPVKHPHIRPGYQLPHPPGFTLVTTSGLLPGTVPTALNFVSGHLRHAADEYSPEIMLRDWGMRRVHDVRGFGWDLAAGDNMRLVAQYDAALTAFGYGRPEAAAHHTYWADEPFVRVEDPRVRWLALTARDGRAEPTGLLLLQGYSRTEAIEAEVAFPGAVQFRELGGGDPVPAADGRAVLTVPANFGTRLFLVDRE